MKLNARKVQFFMDSNLLTQTKLAEVSGVSRVTINSTLAKGSCSTKTAEKIAKALDVEVKELLEV